MKNVLITGGTVYGRLDDNKLVGNRIRGIWATRFARLLVENGNNVTLLLPDTYDLNLLRTPCPPTRGGEIGTMTVVTHDGYQSYAEQCYALAPKMDAAVMAGAVVNWIPSMPIKGKMKTEGYAEGDCISVSFILAPRVIDRMKKLNPKLTLIGCKMTSGADPAETKRQAYGTLLKAHCNVVVANDLQSLKTKTLLYPDGHTQHFVNDFDGMFKDLGTLIDDQFYRTEPQLADYRDASTGSLDDAFRVFDAVVEKYRARFSKRPEGPDGPDRVFGSVAVRIDAERVLVSPREKGTMFSSQDSVVVASVNPEARVIHTVRGKKATLNAPLLYRVLNAYNARAVLHLHEEQSGWPASPYAPPGTVRDNDRTFVTPAFNITGHGFVAALDEKLEFLR